MAVYVNALAFLSISVMMLLGLMRRDAVMIGITLLPVGAITFFALFSHFIPRYMSITTPNMIIALSVSTTWIASWLGSRIRQKFQRPILADYFTQQFKWERIIKNPK